MLEISLLGDLRIAVDGRVVTTVRSARAQALLAYLLVHRRAPQSRQHLAFLFWPDSTEGQARTNLRRELHRQQPTPGPVNYILESTQPATSMDDMIAGMERGLLISRFWYVRLVDPRTIVVTGLTRDGLWWVEKGQVRYPVRNLRFNQSVLAMLAPWNVEAIGAPERRAPFLVPALKLGAFTFTSISDAI